MRPNSAVQNNDRANSVTLTEEQRSSFYADLQQGGSDELDRVLMASAKDANTHVSDDESLEQFRIMAHIEAKNRVKQNTGFDMVEYENRRKLHPEPNKLDYFDGSRKPKAVLPEPKPLTAGSGIRAEEPSLPPPRPNKRYLEPREPLVPDLCDGFVVRGGGIPDGECPVRCLGCKAQLHVNMLATLVRCPDCSTVSPATSSRR